ncbi:VanW family protein [Lachnoclostridium edouardi]|uniref:VanW family protein n=1 Tax=Lachnoclostridium edouardi TaxID=1926283 RepID=UPI000C7E6BF5|nr:VanW family protein [Lachnoclostridium edouardi]
MKKKVWAGGVFAACLAVGVLTAAPLYTGAAELPAGLTAGGQDLGGLTREEADQKIREYVSSMENQKITLEIGDQSVETTAKDLGFHWSNEDAVGEAVGKLTEGNLLKRYMAARDLEKEGAEVKIETAVDSGAVETFVNENCSGLAGAAQDATITRVDGQFQITPSAKGVVVDIEATKNALDQAMAEGLDQPVQVAAVVTESDPKITTEMLETIQDVLGTCTTDFSSSGASRSKNLQVGSAKINGRVLLPGETLSGYECMQPFTTANGYATAAAYENGQVVDSIGGGVCQIATTMYDMALYAELEITQRQNHSMTVAYVKPSMDAAIAGTYKDIKITNNYDTPIYIEAYTSGKKLTFTCYGKETRPANRKVEYISETLGYVDPGAPIEKVDNSMAPGARKRLQSSHTGLRSRLWKVVTVDGKETERTVLHTDTYNASKAIYAVGPAAAPPTEAPAPVETPPAETEPQVAAPVEGVDGGPGVSAPQQSAEAPAAGPGSEAPEAAAPAPQPETGAPQPSAEVPAPQPETPADNGGEPA